MPSGSSALGERVHALAPAPEVVVRAIGRARRRPRRSRWNACECTLAIAGIANGRVTRAPPAAASSALAADRGVLERDLLLRRVADAGLVAHQHHARGPRAGDHARVVAGVADQPRLRRRAGRPAARRARRRGNSVPGDHAAVRRSSSTPASSATRSASAVTASRHDSTVSASGARASSHSARDARDRGRRVRLDLEPRRR